MNEFMQTLLIAVIPACFTGLISYLAARNNSKTQIKAISEQNKADIEKLIEQHKIDIDALKEKHRMELEIIEKEHLHQIEIIKLQHENDIKKNGETFKNQLASNIMSGLFSGIFSSNSPITEELNNVISKELMNIGKKD